MEEKRSPGRPKKVEEKMEANTGVEIKLSGSVAVEDPDFMESITERNEEDEQISSSEERPVQRYLRNTQNGMILPYTEALAGRKFMEEVGPEAAEKAIERPIITQAKYLRNTQNGTVHLWTEKLAELSYMVPCTEMPEQAKVQAPRYFLSKLDGKIHKYEANEKIHEHVLKSLVEYTPPKFIRNTLTGLVFPWTYPLSMRPNMEGFDGEQVVEKVA